MKPQAEASITYIFQILHKQTCIVQLRDLEIRIDMYLFTVISSMLTGVQVNFIS